MRTHKENDTEIIICGPTLNSYGQKIKRHLGIKIEDNSDAGGVAATRPPVADDAREGDKKSGAGEHPHSLLLPQPTPTRDVSTNSSSKMPIDLHESNFSPFCRSVRVLAKRIGVDLNLVPVNMQEGQHKSAEYLEMNPFHTIPVLDDDGFKLFESRAIMTYLVSKYAPDSDLYPKDLQKRALVDAMLGFDSGSLAALFAARVRSIYFTGKDLTEGAVKHGDDLLKSLDLLLSKRKYAAGDNLTVADVAIVHTLALVEVLDVDLGQFSNVGAYSKKVRDDLGQVYKDINDETNQKFHDFIKNKKA